MPRATNSKVAEELARAAELVEAARKSGDRAFRAMLVRVEKTDAERYRAHLLEATSKSTLAARSDGPGGAWREYVFVFMNKYSDWKSSATRRAVAELGRAYSRLKDSGTGSLPVAGFRKSEEIGAAVAIKVAETGSTEDRKNLGVRLLTHPLRSSPNAEVDTVIRLSKLRGSWSADAEDLLMVTEFAIDSIAGERVLGGESQQNFVKPGGWTKSELIEQVTKYGTNISSSTFGRIREAAGISSAERGGSGQQRRFGKVHVRKLIQSAESGRFRWGKEIARAWSDLVNE